MYPNHDSIDNLLIGQKDHIIRLINDGRLDEADAALQTCVPFWDACGYSYKVREVTARLERARQAEPMTTYDIYTQLANGAWSHDRTTAKQLAQWTAEEILRQEG